MRIVATCPTRVDLAGGTLDLWPLYTFFNQAHTINFAIDLNSQVTLKTYPSHSRIFIDLADLQYQKKFSSLNNFLTSRDSEISLIKKVLQYFKPDFGFDLKIHCRSPVGGGLGGSSSLLIALLEAFEKALYRKQDILSRVQLAHNIEASFLGQPTGTQDYFIPILKTGIVIISYHWNGMTYQHFKTPQFIKEKCLFIYTGQPHHSGLNNWKVLKNFIDGDIQTRKALEQIAEVAENMRSSLLNQSLEKDIKFLLDEELTARLSLSEVFSSPQINKLREVMPSDTAMKICGAGGGGCVMIWTDDKQAIDKICHRHHYQMLNTKPI